MALLQRRQEAPAEGPAKSFKVALQNADICVERFIGKKSLKRLSTFFLRDTYFDCKDSPARMIRAILGKKDGKPKAVQLT